MLNIFCLENVVFFIGEISFKKSLISSFLIDVIICTLHIYDYIECFNKMAHPHIYVRLLFLGLNCDG